MSQVLLDLKYGDLIGNTRCEKVALYGETHEDELFMDNLELVIVGKDLPKIKRQLSIGGYAASLFLGDFLSLGKDQILVTAQSGGSDDYAILGLYEIKDEAFILRGCDKDITRLLTFSTQLVNDEQAYVLCEKTQMLFLIETDEEGAKPEVLAPTIIYPIKQPYQDSFSFLAQQRIIGSSNSDILGVIQSVLVFTNQGELVVQNQYLLQGGYEQN